MSEEEKTDAAPLSPAEEALLTELGVFGQDRRRFIGQLSAAGLSLWALQLVGGWGEALAAPAAPAGRAADALAGPLENPVAVRLRINGQDRPLTVDARTTLLDALRERLQLTGSKKGCDHGQCGACTVLVDGRRVLACLTLAATCEDRAVTTVEGLASGEQLHPLQTAFIRHDGFQCGYCTSGQLCSAVALLDEARRGEASYVTADVRPTTPNLRLTDEEIRERMSGNICRCGAYPNIVAAIREVHRGEAEAPLWSFADGGQAPAPPLHP